ncbi:hypothetical protein CEXT_765711 [Caerostris extrusa]|uniref:Uncharacterized protein n=1 Tax=Caerostris extrusa TaxID=172846 RepID=A0AAV4TAX8_CAEEX|nr:hypothetical protein CEXT_765711 [Caerostris extrusa]
MSTENFPSCLNKKCPLGAKMFATGTSVSCLTISEAMKLGLKKGISCRKKKVSRKGNRFWLFSSTDISYLHRSIFDLFYSIWEMGVIRELRITSTWSTIQ